MKRVVRVQTCHSAVTEKHIFSVDVLGSQKQSLELFTVEKLLKFMLGRKRLLGTSQRVHLPLKKHSTRSFTYSIPKLCNSLFIFTHLLAHLLRHWGRTSYVPVCMWC